MYNFPKIQFGNKDFYVVDKFTFEGTTYLYIYEDVYKEGMDIDKFEGDIEVNFIHKVEDGKFENVTDDKLFNKLLDYASKRVVTNKNLYMQQN